MVQYYYGALPAKTTYFKFESYYPINTMVYWSGSLYNSIKPSYVASQDDKINAGVFFNYNEVAYPNIQPDLDVASGLNQQWALSPTKQLSFRFRYNCNRKW